jgi:hypothetical protein
MTTAWYGLEILAVFRNVPLTISRSCEALSLEIVEPVIPWFK